MFNTNRNTRSDEDEEEVYTTQTNIFIIFTTATMEIRRTRALTGG